MKLSKGILSMLNKSQTYFEFRLPHGMALMLDRSGINRIALSIEDLEKLSDWFYEQSGIARDLLLRFPKEPEVKPCPHPQERRLAKAGVIFCLDCHDVLNKQHADIASRSVPVAKVKADSEVKPLTPGDAASAHPTLPDTPNSINDKIL